MIVWQQSLSLDNAGETLRLTYKKIPADPETLVDELSYGNALGGSDTLSALLADTRNPPYHQMAITFLGFPCIMRPIFRILQVATL